MYADIEALVLSGELFNGAERSSSPTRSVESDDDPGWHDEELASAQQERNEKGLDYDSDVAQRDAIRAQQEAQSESIGMGPGRTGVKGVIRDRDEAAGLQREKKAKEAEDLRKKMENANLGGKTFLEEEREKALRGEKPDPLVEKEVEKAEERRDMFGHKREGRFGHLREVGLKGFVSSVENEQRGVWVVVHLYDASLERCYLLDENLARLARSYPDTKFLRAKAAALGFASLSGPSKSKSSISRPPKPIQADDDDPYGDDRKEDSEEEDQNDDNVDLDMLPTMLVYRNGELVHNWVRVDWEAGPIGIDELLDKHHILPRTGRKDNLGFPSDEEDFDVLFSDDEDLDL
ncbi:unnamed protein product [Cyclocybe aegerita]|uniref:Phosducin domain-containing protein n=1 Tax=Cyclocybe aegerita TaxID=1973307 RepID=A0A8S0W5M8_CYCAE|nr:unnamed protein product [Cyclocybe aegerita]